MGISLDLEEQETKYQSSAFKSTQLSGINPINYRYTPAEAQQTHLAFVCKTQNTLNIYKLHLH